MRNQAILIADVSGSTLLYERVGDEAASKLVHECVERMQQIAESNGGEFVRSKGDDILALFSDPLKALAASREILEYGTLGSVSAHAGLHWGMAVWHGSELLAARSTSPPGWPTGPMTTRC